MRIICIIVSLFISVTAFGQQKTHHVFVITLDGFRWQELFTGADSVLMTNKEYVHDAEALHSRFWKPTPEQRRETLMPFFWNTIARHGQLYGNRTHGNMVNCSNNMWFSYPGYNEILCGFSDDERINSNDKIDNPNVTVLEYLNNMPKYKGKVAAFGSWDVFPCIINDKRSGIPVNAGYKIAEGKLSERERLLNEMQSQIPAEWGSVRFDAFTHHYAMEYLKKHSPRVMYISYGETDDFAHDGRYDSYLKSAWQTDQFIKQLWEWVQSHPQYKDHTTFIITTDHGRGTIPVETWKSHGTKINGANQIWFAVIGPDTKALGEIKSHAQYYQNQIAKTAAAFLGVDYTNDEKKVGDKIAGVMGEESQGEPNK
jgi:hypothetical protein